MEHRIKLGHSLYVIGLMFAKAPPKGVNLSVIGCSVAMGVTVGVVICKGHNCTCGE